MPDNNQQPPEKAKARNTPLFIIIAIAVLTPLASTLMFFLWKPDADTATHKGEVIQSQTPPRLFPPKTWQQANAANAKNDWREQWRGKWTLLQTTSSTQCGEQCRQRLCRMRQLRLMLPGHYLRLNRAWLINNPPADSTTTTGDDNTTQSANAESTTIPTLTASNDCGEINTGAAAAKRAEEVNILKGVIILKGDNTILPKASNNHQRQDYLYLIDPAGRLAMRFPPTLNIYNIRTDLSRLLKLSRGWRQTQ